MTDPAPLPELVLERSNSESRGRLNSPELAAEIRNLLPKRLQLYSTWHLLYSLEEHGASLHTLYGRVSCHDPTRPYGYVLMIRDKMRSVFGAVSNEHFHPSSSNRFYGNGQCFLWRMTDLNSGENKDGQSNLRFQAYPYTGLNDFCIFCTHKFLSMGGGDGAYGLWIDSNLERGVSSPTQTFGNETLSSQGSKFDILNLEVWRIG